MNSVPQPSLCRIANVAARTARAQTRVAPGGRRGLGEATRAVSSTSSDAREPLKLTGQR